MIKILKISLLLSLCVGLNLKSFAMPKISNPEDLIIKQDARVIFKQNTEEVYDPLIINVGPNRLVKVMKECRNIDSSVIQTVVQIGDNGIERFKLKLDSDNSKVRGVWIVDLVPFNKENMDISKAKSINKDYRWWYVIYDNLGNPYSVAWARYGK